MEQKDEAGLLPLAVVLQLLINWTRERKKGSDAGAAAYTLAPVGLQLIILNRSAGEKRGFIESWSVVLRHANIQYKTGKKLQFSTGQFSS